MNSKTLVIVTDMGQYLAFRTVTKDQKSPHSFMISKGDIGDLSDLPQAVLCVKDCNSFAQLWRDQEKETLRIHFSWLRSDGLRLSGWEQTVTLPFHDLMAFSRGDMGERWAVLSLAETSRPKLVFQSSRNLHAAVKDCRIRRKLSKALRDNFHWYGTDQIVFYDDFEPYSFFFREFRQGRAGICGGLILHDREELSKAHYSIHT